MAVYEPFSQRRPWVGHRINLPAGIGSSRQEPARLAGASNVREDAVSEDVPLPDGSQPESSQPGPSHSASRPVGPARRVRPRAVALVLGLGVATVVLTIGVVLSEGATRMRTTCCLPEPATAAGLARAHWSVLPPSPLGPRSDPILTWTAATISLHGRPPHQALPADIARWLRGHWKIENQLHWARRHLRRRRLQGPDPQRPPRHGGAQEPGHQHPAPGRPRHHRPRPCGTSHGTRTGHSS